MKLSVDPLSLVKGILLSLTSISVCCSILCTLNTLISIKTEKHCEPSFQEDQVWSVGEISRNHTYEWL